MYVPTDTTRKRKKSSFSRARGKSIKTSPQNFPLQYYYYMCTLKCIVYCVKISKNGTFLLNKWRNREKMGDAKVL